MNKLPIIAPYIYDARYHAQSYTKYYNYSDRDDTGYPALRQYI